MLALVFTHEIGHALGRTQHNDHYADTTGVMTCANFSDSDDEYVRFNYFVKILLCWNDYNQFPNIKDAVNLRDVLGITTIDISS